MLLQILTKEKCFIIALITRKHGPNLRKYDQNLDLNRSHNRCVCIISIFGEKVNFFILKNLYFN